MRVDLASLEKHIEHAWLLLGDMGQSARRTLYLTRRGTIVGFDCEPPAGAELIGTYTRMIELDHLREDVQFAQQTLDARRR